MKKNTHLLTHDHLTINHDGSIIQSNRLIKGRKNLHLEIDVRNHPAWIKEKKNNHLFSSRGNEFVKKFEFSSKNIKKEN